MLHIEKGASKRTPKSAHEGPMHQKNTGKVNQFAFKCTQLGAVSPGKLQPSDLSSRPISSKRYKYHEPMERGRRIQETRKILIAELRWHLPGSLSDPLH